MKIQDILFVVIVCAFLFLFRKRPRFFIAAGLILLALSIPLFSFWVFFTAQRIVYYAAGFFSIGLILQLFQRKDK